MSHQIARIVVRNVRRSAIFNAQRNQYFPSCRKCGCLPIWNIQYEYATVVRRGVRRSLYWCETCLPEKYREVAESMTRGKEESRVLQGETAADFATPGPPRPPEPGSRIPWRQLL